ncbi:S9 family peptidase, partial [bacterium]|nr:S9 family peptidase [bacterium]
MALARPMDYPAIADLAEPVLKLAGVRVNPRTNNERNYVYYWTGLAVKDLVTGRETTVGLPASVKRIGRPRWNADGTMFAFTSETDDRLELWAVDAVAVKAFRVEGAAIDPLLGAGVQWLPDQRSLLARLVPAGRGQPPAAPAAPAGPRVLEGSGTAAASSTYEARDVLKTPHDADLFDHYATCQLARVELPSCRVTPLGTPAVYGDVQPSPDGRFLLVERYRRPYSYQRAYWRFPCAVELWTADGRLVETLAQRPLAESVPIDGEVPGPREHQWRQTEPATVVWAEALDGGDPEVKVPCRDRIMQMPVAGQAAELCRTEHRFSGIEWIEDSPLCIVHEYDRDRRWVRALLRDAADPAAAPRVMRDHNLHEKFDKPGYPVSRRLANGATVVRRDGDRILLSGEGFVPNNQRPFLDRMSLTTMESERLWRSAPDRFETFAGWVDRGPGTFITWRESQTEPPNFHRRTLTNKAAAPAAGEAAWKSDSRALTDFPDPQPVLRKVKKRIVTYRRADSLDLSFTLYLPPNYKKGTRLPTIVWAYPGDISSKEVAGQVSGSPNHFTTLRGTSIQLLTLAGYAVLDNAAMPVVGPPATTYDGFVEQIVLNAQAAVDQAVAMGITDRDRVAVGGHSHGGLMTANLLAHSDIFRAGIACSGAYNHTLRPFGFQQEKRTLWQAKAAYERNSPLMNADKIDEPLLLVHGEVDANPGTVPLQSEKLYDAVRGLGGTVRLVMLPFESHGYQARESVETVLAEWVEWLDEHVKHAPPRPAWGA